MHYAVTCWVTFAVIWQGKPNTANYELKGYEVKEINSSYSLVDFTAAMKATGLQYTGNTVRPINMTLCKYTNPENIKFFNSRGK
jgi:hypothetical protein